MTTPRRTAKGLRPEYEVKPCTMWAHVQRDGSIWRVYHTEQEANSEANDNPWKPGVREVKIVPVRGGGKGRR